MSEARVGNCTIGDTACVDARLIAHARQVLDLLNKKKKSIITAESCTAGLISAVLSQGDGAGEVLHGSFVTYSKANKSMALGVPAQLLASRGSVNEDVVRALADGALARSPADLSLAVSGVLGPDPDEDGNPVGLVYFFLAERGGKRRILRKDFAPLPHDTLRHMTVITALDLVADYVRAAQ
jgi:nicotinamide-nucleotide amidase